MNEEEEIHNLIDDLVAMGALIRQPDPVGGEIMYNVNSERMVEVMPSLYDLFMEEIEQTMLSLYEQGLVKIEYDENLKALYSLTEEGHRVVESIIITHPDFDV